MFLFAILALPPTLVNAVAAFKAHEEVVTRVRENAEHFALLASTYERTLIDQSERLLDNVAREAAVTSAAADGQTGPCNRILLSAIEPYPIYASLILFSRDGAALCSSNTSYLHVNTADRDWFIQTVRSRAAFLSGLVIVRGAEVPAIVLTQPLWSPQGDIQAVLAISFDLKQLQPFERFRGLPRGGAIYLLDRDGVVLTGLGHPTEIGDRGLPDRPISELIDGQTLVSVEAPGADGVERFYAIAPMHRGGLFIVVGLPRSQTTLGWLDLDLPIQLFGIAAMWLAGLLAAWLGTRFAVTRWTGRLTATTRAMSQGDLSARADLAGAPVEIRRFGETLGEMAAHIEARRQELQEAVHEKDTLLREIHHRVKNNLQTVISLLNLQTKGIRVEGARLALQQLKMRIQTLGLVHRHLYESEGLKSVDLRTFLGELCRLLQDGSGTSYWQVRCNLDIAPVSLPIERAVPLALLVTELVTNSFKHGFPDGRAGTINVQLMIEQNDAKLLVADDGIGTSPTATGSESGERAGLGVVLIEALARQLGGTIAWSGPPGTAATVSFPLIPPKPSPDDDLGTGEPPSPGPDAAPPG